LPDSPADEQRYFVQSVAPPYEYQPAWLSLFFSINFKKRENPCSQRHVVDMRTWINGNCFL